MTMGHQLRGRVISNFISSNGFLGCLITVRKGFVVNGVLVEEELTKLYLKWTNVLVVRNFRALCAICV
jgi:hypothetical protein